MILPRMDAIVVSFASPSILHTLAHSVIAAIVKIFARYADQPEDSSWGMGTGWLAAPDVLVTAGHVADDFGRETHFGRAIVVKAYIGYSGANNIEPSLTSGHAQLRYGKTFITTAGWLQSRGGEERYDVAFLKLSEPFVGRLSLFSYAKTPLLGNQESIGVVGYPADKRDRDGEQGAEMYEQFERTNWNLNTSEENMLQYSIDTYPGK